MEESWSGGAESVLNLPKGSSIPIEYHSLFGSHDDLLLLEVDHNLLPQILQNRVAIRGQPDEEAVLCTPSTTYSMKFMGTSNSVFLVPSGTPDTTDTNSLCTMDVDNNTNTPMVVASVIKVAPGTMELTQVAPRLDKLKSLLKQRPYKPDEEETEMELDDEYGSRIQRGLYTQEDLTDLVQTSDEELAAGLKALSAVEIDGLWRIVDRDFMDVVLNMILRNSVIHDWLLSSLKEDDVLSTLEADGFPSKIVHHCLTTYGNKLVSQDGASLWGLDEKKICLHFAKNVLVKGKMKLENFMEAWMSSLPSGMHADLEMLDGEVLYEKIGIETWLRAFSVSELPSTPAERFAALFTERPKWEGKDLQPFISDLRVPGVSAEGLLIKYTRKTQPTSDAEPVFSVR